MVIFFKKTRLYDELQKKLACIGQIINFAKVF